MGKRIAIVGSRDFPDLDAVRDFVASLPPDTVVISGGAPGVDRTAAAAARFRGLAVVEHLADWKAHGMSAGPRRNALIVADCDELVAFWDGVSRGTLDAIRKARAARKPDVICCSMPGWDGEAWLL